MKRSIKSAAIKSSEGHIFVGQNHPYIFRLMDHLGIDCNNSEQGFITSQDEFIGRHWAAIIAIDAKQVNPIEVAKRGYTLFSEELIHYAGEKYKVWGED